MDEDVGTASLTIERTGDELLEVSADCVAMSTLKDNATENKDFRQPANSTILLEMGETEKDCEVPIVDSNIPEPDETFTVNLTNPLPDGVAALGSPSSVIVMIDDDDIFTDGFESGNTAAWGNTVPPLPFSSSSPQRATLRVLGDAALACGPYQLAPAVEVGTVRLRAPSGDTRHITVSSGGAVVLDRDVPARAGEVIEIAGLRLAPHDLEIRGEDRSSRHSIELTVIQPCAVLEIEP